MYKVNDLAAALYYTWPDNHVNTNNTRGLAFNLMFYLFTFLLIIIQNIMRYPDMNILG